MSQTTHIAWASHTASPWFGCTEVSPGCANCYARELTLNHKWAGWGDKSSRVRSKGFWKDAYVWDRKASREHFNWAVEHPWPRNGVPPWQRPRIFTSLMDWLDPQVPIEWLSDFLKVVHDCQNLDWLLLSKRPELWKSRLWSVLNAGVPQNMHLWLLEWVDMGVPPQNIWFGVTVENQAMADKRIPILLSIPAKIRWLSVEPLLDSVSLFQEVCSGCGKVACDSCPCGTTTVGPSGPNNEHIDWIVVGGESGSKRRDCGVEAIINVAEQCKAAGVPCFVKQDCSQRPGQQGRIPDHIWALKQFPAANHGHVWPKGRG